MALSKSYKLKMLLQIFIVFEQCVDGKLVENKLFWKNEAISKGRIYKLLRQFLSSLLCRALLYFVQTFLKMILLDVFSKTLNSKIIILKRANFSFKAVFWIHSWKSWLMAFNNFNGIFWKLLDWLMAMSGSWFHFWTFFLKFDDRVSKNPAF